MTPNREELYQALRNADKAGDTAGASKLAAYIQSLPEDAKSAAPAPAAVNKDYQAGRGAPDWKRGLASGVNGVMLGFGDEALGAIGGAYDTLTQKGQSLAGLVAGTKPKTLAENYVANRDTLRGMQDANQEAHPWATGINNAIGSLPLMMVSGPAGVLPQALRTAPTAVKVAGVVPNALRAAATGTAVGTVAGAGGSTASTASGVAADALESGLVSGALGGGLSPVAAGMGAVGRNVTQRMSTSSAAQYAKEKIAESLARDARGTLATGGYTNPLTQAAARMAKLGDEATLADAGGRNTNQLLDTLATLPGRTKDAAYNVLRQRTAGVGDRMRTAAEDALGTQGQRLPTTVESLITRRETDSAPLYARLRQTEIKPSPELVATVEAAEKLGMIKTGRDIATAKQVPFTLDSAKPEKWNMGDLDHVKQGIDDALAGSKAIGKDGNLTPLGTAYLALKNKLVPALDAATTNPQTGESLYRNARSAFSEPSKLIDAANAGKLAINRDESSIMSTMQGMSANELQAFRIGAFEGLRAKLGTQGGQTQIMNMWKEPATQEKLKAVFGDLRSYREFASSVAKEAQLRRLQSVGAGSQTAARAAGMGDLDLSALTEAGGGIAAAKSGNLLSALGSAKNVWNRVATPQSVRDQMGSMLLAKGAGGAENLNSLEALVQNINNRNMLLSNGVGVFGGQVGSKLATPAPAQLK